MGHVIVYYWAGAKGVGTVGDGISSGISYGHIALKIVPNEEIPEVHEYISFWPGTCKQHNQHRQDAYLCNADTAHFHTKDQDDLTYGDRLAETIVLTTLDVNSIIESYMRFKQGNFMWSTFGSSPLASEERRNCVGLSLMLLNHGGFQKYISDYYVYGLIIGGISSLPIISYFAYMFYMIKLGIEWDDHMWGGAPGYHTITGPTFISLAAFASIASRIGILKRNSLKFKRDTRGIMNSVGALFLGGISWIYFFILEEHARDGGYKFLSKEILKYIDNSVFSFFLFPPIATLLGAYMAGLLVKIENEDIFDPGFFAGFFASLPGPLAGFITTFLVANLTELTEKFFMVNQHNSQLIKIELKFGIINTLCASLAAYIGSYLGAMLFNYLIYKSVSTPRDLYKMSIHAHEVEKNKLLPLENLEGENNAVIGYLYEKITNNKGKILVGAGLVATIGFFSWRGCKIPTNINDKLSSIVPQFT